PGRGGVENENNGGTSKEGEKQGDNNPAKNENPREGGKEPIPPDANPPKDNGGAGDKNTGGREPVVPKNPPDVKPPPVSNPPNPPPVAPRDNGAPAGVEITNLLPRNTQGVFQLNFKEFLDSPMGVAAFRRSGAFD